MPSSVYYVQSCPTCSRRLQVRVDYLGKAIRCPHCDTQMVAQQESAPVAASESGLALMDRADELLKAVERYRAKQAEAAEAEKATA